MRRALRGTYVAAGCSWLHRIPVGVSLLAIASGQTMIVQQMYRHREQAHSYKSLGTHAQAAKRGAEAPLLNRLTCSFFIVLGWSVVVFGDRSLYCVLVRPPSGVKSKRIFLSADSL